MLTILQTGMLLTLQDRGRLGYRRYGVPTSGALDPIALHLANRLVGNPPDQAVLEITGAGCRLQFSQISVIALVGADLGATLNDQAIPNNIAWLVRPNNILAFQQRINGARVYLAVSGGFTLPAQLGSRSSLLGSPLHEPLNRALQVGDQLAIAEPNLQCAGQSIKLNNQIQVNPTIRYLPSQHDFADAEHQKFTRTQWQVSSTSNRMGYRLDGATLQAPNIHLNSFGVVPGVIQVPPDGQPIVLLADAQTTGGYPVLGCVISADLRLFAQLLPNDALNFAPTSLEIAQQVWQEQQKWREGIRD